jgi:hypothetical protein
MQVCEVYYVIAPLRNMLPKAQIRCQAALGCLHHATLRSPLSAKYSGWDLQVIDKLRQGPENNMGESENPQQIDRTPLNHSQDLFVESVVDELFLFNELGPLITKKSFQLHGRMWNLVTDPPYPFKNQKKVYPKSRDLPEDLIPKTSSRSRISRTIHSAYTSVLMKTFNFDVTFP